jgi:hypothetical protein
MPGNGMLTSVGQVRLYLLGSPLTDLQFGTDSTDAEAAASGEIFGEDVAACTLSVSTSDTAGTSYSASDTTPLCAIASAVVFATDEEHQQLILWGSKPARTRRSCGATRSAMDQQRAVAQQVLHQDPRIEDSERKSSSDNKCHTLEMCCRSLSGRLQRNVVQRPDDPMRNS